MNPVVRQAPIAEERSWSLMNVLNGAANVANKIFDFKQDAEEFSLTIRPLNNFSREIRMLLETFNEGAREQTPVQKQLLQYGLKLIENARSLQTKNHELEIQRAKDIIGKLIFLADNCPDNLEKIVEFHASKDYPEFINEYFKNHLTIFSYQVKICNETQNSSKISVKQTTNRSTIHIQIAKILITKNGVLNSAIAEPVIKQVREDSEPGLYSCLELINSINQNEDLFKIFDFIRSPAEENSIIYDLIRCILKEKLEVDVTSALAKQAVLAATLDIFADRDYEDSKKFKANAACSKFLQ